MTAESGYTLPVFACASAMAAFHYLQTGAVLETVTLDLLEPPTQAAIPIEQVAPLPGGGVLAITRSAPGDNLDLTRDTPVWAVVAWADDKHNTNELLTITAGEGVGWHQETGQAAIYQYAQRLLHHHLQPARPLRVEMILPQGRKLAERTSNAAFGVVEGLALLGTSGIAHPLSAPEQLESFREELRRKADQGELVFCIGENGLDLARSWGISEDYLVKTGNWLGPLLLEASLLQIQTIILLGYHGKLLKLAGGIFHTHHHLADARLEILTACGLRSGLSLPILQKLLTQPTVDAAMSYLQQVQPLKVRTLYEVILTQIQRRTQQYLHAHGGSLLTVEVILFNRQRQVVAQTPGVKAHLTQWRGDALR
ncbi:cobalamin biosynthesis protein CbiD [Gloeomargarita lithophora Alchichica-D10]|uniref:Cobalt-precorrin-5B C(1)-methyltransferase n=1 Tax=Gloeomargarita lithophora Alchichica-D10 TaxID=1188229 RepID=A0A1J0A9Z0_9CYAN|nr:cobalt-precorrin-5B (C(1))-methyltransferase CbiD [Gloeomargarita lithophora]APB32713.1 cobalamin biosynthesis protein CbiD [Gloeomargarita lithophora Alchichica-D10]